MGAIFKRVPRPPDRRKDETADERKARVEAERAWEAASWRIRYIDQHGRLVYESARTTSKQQAKRTLVEREAAANRGEQRPAATSVSPAWPSGG